MVMFVSFIEFQSALRLRPNWVMGLMPGPSIAMAIEPSSKYIEEASPISDPNPASHTNGSVEFRGRMFQAAASETTHDSRVIGRIADFRYRALGCVL
jgi:hypothetical protein